MTTKLQDFTNEDFCYLTTTGRISGRPHTIEIWFALDGHTRDLTGGMDGGTITLLTTSGCGRQTYSVTGHLTLAPGGTSDASFAMFLTHYRLSLFGRCITYGATVQGSVTFHISA